MDKPIIIGVAGGSASGKTTIVNLILEAFSNEEVTIIRHDDYYKDQSDMTMQERILANYDHPFSLDNDLLVKDLIKFINKESFYKPIYDFTIHTRSDKTELIKPTDILILEGILVLEDPKLRDLMDIKIYVETDDDIRFIRRLIRDMNERKRSIDSVINQYSNTVKPMHNQFVEPSKRYADIIIPNGGENKVAIDIMITKIKSIISK